VLLRLYKRDLAIRKYTCAGKIRNYWKNKKFFKKLTLFWKAVKLNWKRIASVNKIIHHFRKRKTLRLVKI